MRKSVSHPWHGIEIQNKDQSFNAYIEIVPGDKLKYELCKKSGHLKVCRPQRYSNNLPCLYGFLPKTYSNIHSANFAMEKTNRTDIKGDKDPVDICVFTNYDARSGIIVKAEVIGGLRMIDGGEIDDKLIAVLKQDPIYGDYKDITDLNFNMLEQLKHYFLTYKGLSNDDSVKNYKKVEILGEFNREEALKIIENGKKDYLEKFSN